MIEIIIIQSILTGWNWGLKLDGRIIAGGENCGSPSEAAKACERWIEENGI